MLITSLRKRFLSRLNFRSKLSPRQYLEHEQAIIRIFVGLLLLPVYLTANRQGGPWVVLPIWIFVVASILYFAFIVKFSNPQPLRYLFAIVLDLGTTTYLMVVSSDSAAAFYGIYLWVTIGNGFRFGIKYLYLAQFTSIVGFSTVLWLSPFWSLNLALGAGLMLALIAVPLYAALLLKRVTAAQRHAEQANEAKSRFLATISHEMRTPLTGIIGVVELMLSNPLNAEQRRFAETLRASSKILSSLIGNVLDLAKIEAGKVAIEKAPFDLDLLLHHAVSVLNNQGGARGLRLSVNIMPEVPCLLIGDQQRLHQILLNLVGNAIKFTQKGFVRCAVHLVGESQDQAVLRFEVKDSGIGIALEHQNHIFESFAQADESIHRRYGGSGLGTTICKHLVELMGGTIGLSSQVGQGSTFWFEVPLTKQNAEVSPASLAGCRLLLLSVDPTLYDTINGYALRWGATCMRFESVSVLSRLAVEDPDNAPCALLVDARMPVDVIRLPESISAQPAFAQVPLILVNNETFEPEQIFDAGYFCTLNHPLPDLLFRAVRSLSLPHRLIIETPSQIPALHPADSGRELSVLVAEDNLVNQEVLEMILRRAGSTVTLVGTGEEAMDALDGDSFDVVVLDMNMPGMRGSEVAKFIRMTDRKPLPIIMLTAAATEDVRRECERAGADLFLTKPIEPHKLIDAVRHVCAKAAFPLQEVSVEGRAKPGEVLDVSTLRQLGSFAQDATFMPHLVDSFLTDAQKLVNAIEASLVYGRYSDFRETAHALKGSASTIGAHALKELCASLGKLDEHALEARHDDIVEQFRGILVRTQAAIIDFARQESSRLPISGMASGL